MTRTYTINSLLGFLGFCSISDDGPLILGGLTFFETVLIDGKTLMGLKDTNYANFEKTLSDTDVIKSLMQTAIPSMGTNDLTYTAVDAERNVLRLSMTSR
jgi:hypothetical protein